MRIFVDTTFLKCIAYRQAGFRDRVRLLAAAERGALELRVPAVCVLETAVAVASGNPARRELLRRAEEAAGQARRGLGPGAAAVDRSVTRLGLSLRDLDRREAARSERLRTRLSGGGFVVPLTGAALILAAELELPPDLADDRRVGYGPADAAVLATVLTDLADEPVAEGETAAFLTDDRRFREHPRVRKAAAAAGLILGRKPTDLLGQAVRPPQTS